MTYQHVNNAALEGTSHVGELHVPPAALVAAFGMPSEGTSSTESVGEYYFRSANGQYLVIYLLYTDDAPEDLEEAGSQFWALTEPVPFSIGAQRECDVENFKHWIQVQIKNHS